MTEDRPIDPDLFKRFKRGDPAAMSELFRRYQKRLIGFLRIYTRSLEISEELVQEVFLDAYQQREGIREASGLKSWLFTVAKRKAIRYMQKKDQQLLVTLDQEALEDLSPTFSASQERVAQMAQAGQYLQIALSQLNTRDQELVTLRFFGGLQVKEISQVMGIPMGSVGVFLTRSLEKIRLVLEAQGIRPEDVVES